MLILFHTAADVVSVNDSGSGSDSEMDEDYDETPPTNGHENPLDRNYMTDFVANNQHSSNPKTVSIIIRSFIWLYIQNHSIRQYAFAKNYISPTASASIASASTSASSSSPSEPMYRSERKLSTATNHTATNHTTTAANNHLPNDDNNLASIKKAPIDTAHLYTEILNEIKRANALADLEREETNFLHNEMKELEQQRFQLTQLFVEKSLSLQQQMLKCLQANNGVRSAGGGGGSSGGHRSIPPTAKR